MSPDDFEARFKEIFDSYKDRLYSYALWITHSNYLAEEIVQDIFLKLWTSREALHTIDSMDRYLFAMVRNRTVNVLKKIARDRKLIASMAHFMSQTPPPTEDRTAIMDLEKLLHEALNTLSPQRKLVYQLSRVDGLDYASIAEKLQISRNTVKNHLVAALRSIRNHLNLWILYFSWLAASIFF